MSTVTPADIRAALTRIGIAIHALLAGDIDPVLHRVTTRDLHRMRRALADAGLYKSSTRPERGGLGGFTSQTAGENSASTSKLGKVSNTTSPNGDVSTAPGVSPRTTWLTPYWQPYVEAYGESPTPNVAARLARAVKQLETAHPRAEVARRFAIYVRATPARFYAAERFAATFPAWRTPMTASGKVDPREPLPGEDTDAYLARLFPPSVR